MRGRCLCGRVRVASEAPTLFASHCHCETCRRAHAAAFVTWTAVPVGALLIEGEEHLTHHGSSPGVTRSFCAGCGTPMLYRGASTPDRVYLPVAVLEGLDRPVDSHVSYEERVPWLAGVERLPCFRAKTDEPLRWEGRADVSPRGG